MTYNNFQIYDLSPAPPAPNYYIYDGIGLALFHDGLNRHIILKTSKTGVSIPEPNTNSSNYAYILGSGNNIVYIINPGTRQLIKLAVNNQSIQESNLNINDFNTYKDISIVGTNQSLNDFIPQGGTVINSTIVIGGKLSNPSGGLTIDGATVPNNAICYMLSTDSGATFSGPYFPFAIGNSIFTGTVVNAGFYNDNWYFHIIKDETGSFSNSIVLVQTLKTNLSGDYLEGHPVNTSSSNNIYQLPFIIFNNRIYFCSTDLNTYYEHNLETDVVVPNTPGFKISNFTIVNSTLTVSYADDCNSTELVSLVVTGGNNITNFNIGGIEYNTLVKAGKAFIDDSGGAPSYNLLGGNILNSDHYTQPIDLIS